MFLKVDGFGLVVSGLEGLRMAKSRRSWVVLLRPMLAWDFLNILKPLPHSPERSSHMNPNPKPWSNTVVRRFLG